MDRSRRALNSKNLNRSAWLYVLLDATVSCVTPSAWGKWPAASRALPSACHFAEVCVASPWDNALPNLVSSLADKVLFCTAAAFIGFWLQKRLELFKRNQAFAAEVAKLYIGAYYRALASVSALDAAGLELIAALRLPAVPEEAKSAAAEKYLSAEKALESVFGADSHLFTAGFVGAIGFFSFRLNIAVARAGSGGYASEEEWERDALEIATLRHEISVYLPGFAKAPNEAHFTQPRITPRLAEMAGMTVRALKAQVEPKKGEAP
jgi:hypothetical protein